MKGLFEVESLSSGHEPSFSDSQFTTSGIPKTPFKIFQKQFTALIQVYLTGFYRLWNNFFKNCRDMYFEG